MEIRDIVEAVDISDYIGQYVDLDEENGDLFGLCPFHSEDTPSFHVTPENGTWHCFGCHAGGDILTFIQKYHNVGFNKALNKLGEYAGISTEEIVEHKNLSAASIMRRYRTRERKQRQPTYKPLPTDIMSRYVWDEEKFSSWLEEGIGVEELRKYQVRYDQFTNRIVYPIRSSDGTIINVAGRTLDPDFKEKRLRKYTYFYDLGILDTLFGYYENLDEIKRKKEIILFEGAKSVMCAETFGFKNGAAVLTSRLNEFQLKLLIQLGCRVVVAFDSEVDIRADEQIKKLKHFVPVEWVRNRENLLEQKMAPVDAGREVWKTLYDRRERL